MISLEEAANLTDIPNVEQKGTRLGNWLTREQAKELLTVPDRSKLKGKRNYVIIALLVGCALRRQELETLNIEDIQLREGRWVIIDLRGKGGRILPVAIPACRALEFDERAATLHGHTYLEFGSARLGLQSNGFVFAGMDGSGGEQAFFVGWNPT